MISNKHISKKISKLKQEVLEDQKLLNDLQGKYKEVANKALFLQEKINPLITKIISKSGIVLEFEKLINGD